MSSELLDLVREMPIPLKEWLIPVLLVASFVYRLYKRFEPQIYRRTLNDQAVEAVESYMVKAGGDADSPVMRVIADARERHAFHRVSNMDAKEPLRTMMAKLHAVLPEADWTMLKEAQPYVRAYREDESAVTIHVPWIDVVGNGVTFVTSIMMAIVATGLMFLIFEIAREARDFILLFFLAVLSMIGSVLLLVASVPPIRAAQLRRMIRESGSSEIRLVNPPRVPGGLTTHAGEAEVVSLPERRQDVLAEVAGSPPAPKADRVDETPGDKDGALHED